MPFDDKEPHQRGGHQNRGGDQREFGVQRPMLGTLTFARALHHVQHHGEAERADECADEDRQAHTPVGYVQTRGVGGEAGVVVCGNGVEDRLPQGAAGVVLVVDAEQFGQQQGEGQRLGDGRDGKHHGDDAFDLGKLVRAEFVGGEHALRHPEPTADAERHDRSIGNLRL